jgi:hypothetical protein
MKRHRWSWVSRGPRSASWWRRCCLVLALLEAGCVYHWHPPQGAATAWDPAAHPELPAVQVVTSEQVGRAYKTIGTVHASGSMGEREALIVLKQEAQALHGDALLDVRKRDVTATPTDSSISLADQPWEADVIVWTDHPAETVALGGPSTPPHAAP